MSRTLVDALDFVRHRPVTLRFIELMQTRDNTAFFGKQHFSAASIEAGLQAEGWQLVPRSAHAGPAREYRHRDFAGGIGFIAPYSKDFCQSCNRLRVTAQGKMHLCLKENLCAAMAAAPNASSFDRLIIIIGSDK